MGNDPLDTPTTSPTEEWDVRTSTGALVGTLPELATALFTDETTAAKALLADPAFTAAAPETLRAEAKTHTATIEAKAKAGGPKPPPIANGSFVAWGGKKGQVDLIVTNGKVPGVDGDVEGSEKTPAARVVVYEDDKATSQKVGVSTHTLKRIPPLGRARPPGQKALVAVVARHDADIEELGLPEYAAVTGEAVKTVYDRGLAGYPGENVVGVDAGTWAIERVGYFVKVASGDETEKPGHDTDLLNPGHPLFTGTKPPAGLEPVDPPPGTEPVAPEGKAAEFVGGADHVTLDRQAVDDEVAALLEGMD